jgi:hypothetical protein
MSRSPSSGVATPDHQQPAEPFASFSLPDPAPSRIAVLTTREGVIVPLPYSATSVNDRAFTILDAYPSTDGARLLCSVRSDTTLQVYDDVSPEMFGLASRWMEQSNG